MKHLALKSLFAVCMLSSTQLFAQQETVDTAVFSQIRKAELSSSQIPNIAHYLTDVAGPRLTNSPGFMRAATWAVETMKKWGMANAALEPWGTFGKNWEIREFSIAMTVPYMQPVMAYPAPWSPNTNGVQKAQVTAITRAQSMDTTYIAQHLVDLKGKIILVDGGAVNTSSNFKPTAERLTDAELADLKDSYMVSREMIQQYVGIFKSMARADVLFKQSGAIAIISTGGTSINGTVVVQSFNAYKLGIPETLPKVSMAAEDCQKIKRLIKSGHPVELELNIQGKISPETKGYNVVGEITGTDPKLKSQLVMLGGHLDSWSAATGATDNAAGSIVMLEAVRLLDSLHLKPKRTIRIALWSGEEQGLLGSFNYAKIHFIDNGKVKPEQAKVSAYYNLDNGTGKIRGIYTQSNEAIKPIFEQWLVPFHDLGATTVTTKNTGSTDHLSFDWAGIPGFQFVQDPLDYETRTHHSNQDNYDHLQIDDLKQAAIIVASFVYQSSVRPALLPRKPLVIEPFAFDGF
jgi:carboxypeptidase Q